MIRSLSIIQLFCILLVPVCLNAQIQAPTLEELMESALNKDHSLARQTLDIEDAEIELQQLKEVYLPNASVSGQYGFLANNVNIEIPATTLSALPVTIPELHSGFSSTGNLVKADLGVSAILYTGGKVPALKQAVKEKIKAQTALREKDRQQIISEVYKVYDQLALLQQVEVILAESEKRLEVNSKTADKAFAYGLITKYEKQKIEVARAQLNAKKLSFEGQRNLLLHQMAMYTGLPAERLALLRHILLPLREQDQQAGTVENRPEITALEASIAARGFQLKAAQTWWLPKVKAGTSVGYFNFFSSNIYGKTTMPLSGEKLHLRADKIEIAPNFNIGVGLQWDIFDGLKGKRATQHARIAMHKAQLEKEEAMEKLQLYRLKAATDYANANAEIDAKRKEMEIAENALLQAGKEFKTGLIKTADLLDAENDYQNASLAYHQSVFNQRRCSVELLKATGDLSVSALQQ